MSRPLIGLSGRRKTGHDLKETAASLRDLEADWYYADYARAVYEAGGLPVHLPLDVDPAEFVGRLDGVVITGGADVAPAVYAADPDPETVTEPIRDAFELGLLAGAAEAALPVLGICRGLQVLNVHAGGTLHQHVPEHARYDMGAKSLVHDIEIAEDSTLGSLYGPHISVNSLHHQTVDRLGDNLRITATHDGDVEGIEHTQLPMIAVQWHPEMLATRSSDPIFAWLVDHAKSAA